MSESNREYVLQTGHGGCGESEAKSMHKAQTLSSMLQVQKPSSPVPSAVPKMDEAVQETFDITFDVSESSQEEEIEWEDDDGVMVNG